MADVTWIADPVTRQPMGPIPSREREMAYNNAHWREGWRSGTVYEGGVPVRMWFAQCQDDCCAEYRANLPPLESYR